MFPFILGFLLVAAAVGGVENLPPGPSASAIGVLFSLAVLGVMLMLAGLKRITLERIDHVSGKTKHAKLDKL